MCRLIQKFALQTMTEIITKFITVFPIHDIEKYIFTYKLK